MSRSSSKDMKVSVLSIYNYKSFGNDLVWNLLKTFIQSIEITLHQKFLVLFILKYLTPLMF
uniref:Uncharacterized protein n=2 Tax=Lepeophtheirus salmonis TaxID=72036 RepID=A0A0K2TK15_LEPSM